MSISDLRYYEDDIDTGERMAQCDNCGRVTVAVSEAALFSESPGWVFACTTDGDDGVSACPGCDIWQSLKSYGVVIEPVDSGSRNTPGTIDSEPTENDVS